MPNMIQPSHRNDPGTHTALQEERACQDASSGYDEGREPYVGEKVTASIHSADPAHSSDPAHSADPARVLTLAAIADIAAPVPALEHCAVCGIRVLPYPSFAHTGRIDKCLTFCPPQNREGVYMERGPLSQGRLQTEEAQAA